MTVLVFSALKKSNRLFFAVCVLAAVAFFCAEKAYSQEKDRSVITIEQAQKSEYKKDKVNGGDCIILTGDVKVSVVRGNTRTTINADRITYNRSTEMIYAEGNVSLEQTDSSEGGEKITAASLLFNTATLEGVFDNGRAVQTSSDAINLPSGSTLIVASNVFGRDSGGTIAFKSGELTFCDDENPHWKILASRIWLLPGGEFAFFNALLFVGRVPLLYLPAFYYPKDELIFNPAFGYKQREGYYINTTTYLYGRKPADAVSTAELHGTSSDSDEDSKIDVFSFMKTGTLKKQKREGIVLHNLDENFDGDTTNYFKVMGDYYANLGAMVGLDGVFTPNDYITDIETNLELGFSNTVFKNTSSDAILYISRNANGDKVQDKSNFLGHELPFRYQANFKFSVSKPFAFSLSLPIYSDPYFDYDFNNRAETMDWIDFLMTSSESTTSSDSSSDTTEISEISSFTWNLNASHSFSLPAEIKPYISTLSISSLSSSVVFSSKTNENISSDSRYSDDGNWGSYSPEQKFYYPSQVTPLKTTLKFAGTIFQYPSKKSKKSAARTSLKLSVPEEFSEEENSDKKTAASNDADENDGMGEKNENTENSTAEKLVLSEDALPLLSVPSFSQTEINGLTYALTYSVTPDFTSQISYSSTKLAEPSDFDWNKMQSTYFQVKSPVVLTSKTGFRDDFISLTDTFTFNPVYQTHPYLNDDTDNGGYSESSIQSIKSSDYSAKKLDLTDVNALTFRPFNYTEHFSDTSLTWNTTIKMVRTKFIGTASNYDDQKVHEKWEYLTTDLTDEECVTVHNLNLILAASEFSKKLKQELSLTTTLPPQVDEYTGTLTLTFPYVTLKAGTGIKQTSSTDDTWIKEDFTESLSVNLFNSKLKFTQSYVYDLEDEYIDSLKLSLSGFGLQLAYTASYVRGYTFDYTENSDGSVTRNGWVEDEDKKFQPYQASLAYTSPSKTFYRWGNRISVAPSLSTSVVYDFLRPTSSYFKFIPAITFKINDFLNITFSSESKNSVIYRYFGSKRDLYYGDIEYEKNPFIDLANSFRFDSDDLRKQSGFKLQNLSITMNHDLDDWDLNASFSIKPRLVTDSSKTYYDFSPYFSVSVVWRPLASMKTQIVDEYGEWELNP